MIVLHHKHNALSKILVFGAGIFCISNRVKRERRASGEQWTGAAPLSCSLLHSPGGIDVELLFKVCFSPEEHLCKESSCRSFSFTCQSCTCSLQMHHLRWGFILASKQCRHSQESSVWSWLLQRQRQPSDLLRSRCSTSSDPQLLMGLQVCPWGHKCCGLPSKLLHNSLWAWASNTKTAALHDAKDSGFSLVLSDGIQQHPQHRSARSQHGIVQGCGIEKGVLVVPVAEFVPRLRSPLLCKRFADHMTRLSV